MPGGPYSPLWYGVSSLKPRLRPHARIHRQFYRGQLWYVLQDNATGRHHRLTPAAYLIIGMMDGRRTVQGLWEAAERRLGDEAPSQDEIIRLLSQLYMSDLLHADLPPDIVEMTTRGESMRRRQRSQRFRNPLAFKVPLFDPEWFLAATASHVRPLFGALGGAVWLGVVALATLMAGLHWTELTDNVTDRVLATENLVLMWLTFPILKLFHEFGHAYACKRWGGEVHEMGIMFLVLTPIPYLDASSASAFRGKWRRAFVGSAGMIVELFIAAIALLLWISAEPGIVRAILFNIVFIASISTVLFNANPLLRFDGYYILSDLIELPNLRQKANQYIFYLLQHYLFGVDRISPPTSAYGEPGWFVFFSLASFVYRLFIVMMIALFLAQKFFFVGVLLAVWAILLMFVFPVLKGVYYLFTSSMLQQRRARAFLVSAVLVALVIGIVGWVPVPLATQVEGVAWVPEGSAVHAAGEGHVVEVIGQPGATVRRGDPLIVMENLEVQGRIPVLEAKLRELSFRHRQEVVADRVQAAITREQIRHVESQLAWSQQRAADLIVRSPADGVFVVPNGADLKGRFVRRGEALGYVVAAHAPIVRLSVPQERIDLVRRRPLGIEVRLSRDISKTIPATMLREVPAASDKLPSKVLSTEGGGEIPLDPRAMAQAIALEELFHFEVELMVPHHATLIGERAFIRFDHGTEPLVAQAYRHLRQLFLEKFDA